MMWPHFNEPTNNEIVRIAEYYNCTHSCLCSGTNADLLKELLDTESALPGIFIFTLFAHNQQYYTAKCELNDKIVDYY